MKNTTLTKLDLSLNPIGMKGAAGIAKLITVNSTLTELVISGEKKNIRYNNLDIFMDLYT